MQDSQRDPPPALIAGAMIMIVLIALGWSALWRLPTVAKDNKVAPADLVLAHFDFPDDRSHFNRAFGEVTIPSNPSSKDIQKARSELAIVFDLTKPAVRKAILNYGKYLNESYTSKQPQKSVPEDSCFFHVWAFFRSQLVDLKLEIPELIPALRRAFPSGEYNSAIKWAKEGYERALGGVIVDPSKSDPIPDLIQLPPNTEFVQAVIVARMVGIDPKSNQKSAEFWLAFFPAENHNDLKKWGGDLRKERKEAGEPVPPGPEEISSVLCVVDRYCLTDPYSDRCKKAVEQSSNGWVEKFAVRALLMGGLYPDDDVYLVLYGYKPFVKHVGVGIFVILSAVVLLITRPFVAPLVGEKILRLYNSKLYHSHRDRVSTTRWVTLAVRLITPVSAWAMSRATANTEMNARLTELEFFLAVYFTTLVCGQIVAVISDIAGMLLMRFGIDPNKSFIDDIIAFPVIAFVMLHFGADLSSILGVFLGGVVPSIASRILYRIKQAASKPRTY